MSSVVIAATNLTPALRERLAGEGDLQTFADSEPIQALQAILDQRPDLIVIERLFAATPRGAALINRIKTDPGLSACEIRVMSHTGDYTRVVRAGSGESEASGSPAVTSAAGSRDSGTQTIEASAAIPAAIEEAPRQLDWHGTRRAPRYRIRSGVEVQLDGNAAAVIDMSVIGAQVVSATILRPNQRVLAGALLLLVMNLIGLGLGPTYLGAVSDYFRPTHPDNSLQLAFYTLVPFYALAIAAFLWLARALKREAASRRQP